MKNQLVTYTPYSYLNSKKTASADIPLLYNTCDSLKLLFGKLSSGLIREYADHIDLYLNNYRNDTTAMVLDEVTVTGLTSQPSYKLNKRVQATASASTNYDEEKGVFTLSVRHNGPVDITINCQGGATERSTDVLNSPELSLDVPKQPEDYRGEIIIEAEDMDYKSIKSCVTDPYNWYPSVKGHAGNGFIDMGTNSSGSLRHRINIKHPGDYRIAIRYNSTQRDGNLSVKVNGASQLVKCVKTGVNKWLKATFDASLTEGTNELIINNSNGINMYIDQVVYTPADVESERFGVTVRQADHGYVVADVDSAAEGQTVTLSVTPEDGYALRGWNVVHGDITISDDGTFVMPDDNVTVQPIFADMSAIYALDFSDVLSGTLPAGWRLVQEDNAVHEYPNSYGSGGRTFAGFTGYQGKGIYWRVNSCEYGRQNAFPLELEAGSYKLSFVMAAWKERPEYKARILDAKNNVVATTDVYAAQPNAGGNTSANLSSASWNELPFDITEKGKYVVSFINNGTGFSEFLLLECRVNSTGNTGIVEHATTRQHLPAGIYSLQGVRRDALQRGINIVVTPDGKSRKVIVR